MRTIDRLRGACVAVLLTTLAPLAAAQVASDILKQSSDALVEAGTLRASLAIRGDGSDLFKSALPTGRVTLLLRREPGDEQENIAPGWTMRMTGAATTGNPKDKEPINLDIVGDGELYRWVDHEQKKIFESPPARALATRSTGYTAARSLVLAEILTEVPFSGELEAEELAVLEPEEVHGVLCDVVEVTYPQTTARNARTATHNVARIAIGREDHLPRRIERVSGSGAYSMSIVLELTELKPAAELEDKDFELPIPEGYEQVEGAATRVSNPSARVTTARTPENDAVDAAPQARPEQPAEVFLPASDFQTTLASGEVVSLESLRGRVAVLYFWGTWSLECRSYGPLVSMLADDYRDRGVQVIGMAARERDPALAVDASRARDYTFDIAPSATEVAESYSVVVYPTFVVIGAGGELIGTERMRRGVDPGDMLGRVRTLIDKALAQQEPGESPTPAGDDSPD